MITNTQTPSTNEFVSTKAEPANAENTNVSPDIHHNLHQYTHEFLEPKSKPLRPIQRQNPNRFNWITGSILLVIFIFSILTVKFHSNTMGKSSELSTALANFENETIQGQVFQAPSLDGGVEWLNCSKPLTLKDLRGKVVLLDFWTLCCINCINIMPDLEKLEKKYPNQLVVIGVHSAKFENERDSASIRRAIARYELKHPVVNDANHAIWNRYQTVYWPTFVLIDPEGNYVGRASGEGNFDITDKTIAKLIEKHRGKKTLNEKPLRFDTAELRQNPTPLYYPGKVLADAASDRLFISDSTDHRIVITTLAGKHIATIGTGKPGLVNGSFTKAQFDDPQGLALKDEILYVADRKNHCIRAIDLKAKSVKTIAGTGLQDRSRSYLGTPTTIGLNSPWDLLVKGDFLYIAMAGHHQIWTLNLRANKLAPYAGSGEENIRDSLLLSANFAQPSGLTTDGKHLYVADSEVSAIRMVPLIGNGDRVSTLVGTGLFDFGDRDGVGKEAILQHAIGVAYHDGNLYIADTYNSKIKKLDLKTKKVTTFIGGKAEPGWFMDPILFEPAGISVANDKLYIADTNANRIRVVDIKTKAITTLQLDGVSPVSFVKKGMMTKDAPNK